MRNKIMEVKKLSNDEKHQQINHEQEVLTSVYSISTCNISELLFNLNEHNTNVYVLVKITSTDL